MPKLTRDFVLQIALPVRGQKIYRDTVLRGFALKVTTRAKLYIVDSVLNGRRKRISIGADGKISLTRARQQARVLIAALENGSDPVAERKRERLAAITLRQVLEHYLSVRLVRANTNKQYRALLRRCFPDWLDRPINQITKKMVEQRHWELRRVTRQGSSGEVQANAAMRTLAILINFASKNYEVAGKSIIEINPVSRLTHNRSWYREHRRQTIIPNHKLTSWFSAVISLGNSTVRDYLLVLLFTGLRRNEAATLLWSDIDLEGAILTIRAEVSKNRQMHQLPLSSFVEDILRRRYENRKNEYVFSGRGEQSHLVDCDYLVKHVGQVCACKFTLHDLRRTFLTMAESLNLSYVVLKKLANHSGKGDTTFGYIIVDVERLRAPMQQITDRFLTLIYQRL